MDNQRIARLNPSALSPGAGMQGVRDGIAEKFKRLYARLRDTGHGDYDLKSAANAIFYLRSLLERKGLTGSNKTVLEIGCGWGLKSFAIHDLFGRVLSFDVERAQIDRARSFSSLYGNNNIEFVRANGLDVARSVDPHSIDLILLYAVVEHLTPSERASVIHLCGKVMDAGGHVLVIEAPNRLIAHDTHTTLNHFFNWLPDEMASRYARSHSRRKEIVECLPDWTRAGAETDLYRLGRGVSFHDFSLNLPSPLSSYSFIADGFDTEFVNMEPVTFQEINLLGYLTANLPEIPSAAFSRSWLDFAAHKGAKQQKRRKFFSPFWPNWMVLSDAPKSYDDIGVTLSRSRLNWSASLDGDYVEDITLLFKAPSKEGSVIISLDGQTNEISIPDVFLARPDTWHTDFAVTLTAQKKSNVVTVQVASADHAVIFKGAVATLI